MASMEFKNNADSTISVFAAGATTLTVTDGAVFPASFPYLITIWDDTTYSYVGEDPNMEIVKCTAKTGNNLTVVRNQEGTGDNNHANGDMAAMLFTAGHFGDASIGIITKLDTIATGADVTGDNAPQSHDFNVHTGEVAVADGGTAATTEQAAINTLSAVAGATNEYVLTKDTGTGNAVFKVATGGLSDPMTTRGDVIVRNASNVTARLGVGTNNQVLTSDGNDIAWATGSTPDDTAYNATFWDDNTDAATKNAIRDKIETMDTAIGLNTAKDTNATHTGEVTGSGALTIAADAVTYAKMQNVVADERILGNVTAVDSPVAELTKAQVLTMIGVADGADVTGSNAPQTHAMSTHTDEGVLATKDTVGSTEIDADSVTYDKMQDTTATDKLLGRSTAGAGTVEEVTCTAAGRAILDDADAAAQRTTLGVDVAGTDNSTDVTLHSSATIGGLSLSTQEISNRAATNAQTGYMTAALVGNIESNNAKVTNATHTGDVTGATALTIGADKVLDSHINWGTGATQVSAVDILIADAGGLITGTEVETALQENRIAIDLNTSKVTNATHTGDVTGATALTIGADKVNDTHIDWGTGANQVSAVDLLIADAGAKITATEVEGALQENRTAIDLNTAKTTNATHTGEVTGSGALTIDKTAITGKGVVTAVDADYVLISDTSDAGALKKALASDFGGAGGGLTFGSGSYAGNDTENRAIAHGLGATPVWVKIYISGYTSEGPMITAAGTIINSYGNTSYTVTSWDGTNFYVGDSADYDFSGNGTGSTYYWVAMV